MATPQRTKASASLAAMSSQRRPFEFSPQRLDAASSLAALFSSAPSHFQKKQKRRGKVGNNTTPLLNNSSSSGAHANGEESLVESPSDSSGNIAAGRRSLSHHHNNAYATPTSILLHVDTDVEGGKRKFPVPDFFESFATPAVTTNGMNDGKNYNNHNNNTNSSFGGGGQSGDEDGRKTKKAKVKKKRERTTNSGVSSSSSSSSSTMKATKKQKVAGITKNPASRKLKALGLLCARFIIMHYKTDVLARNEIKLSELSEKMGIERRRMYDCLNILESIRLVEKLRKDIYIWTGFSRLGETLIQIQKHAEIHGIFDPAPQISACAQGGKSKSLAVLAHQFISMFVTGACEEHVTLDEAAECLAKKDATPAEVKTKARRLYDIANICCTLELVEKYRLPGTSYRKPVYRWTGFQRYPFPLPKNTKIQVPCPVDLFEAAGILNEVPSHLYTEYYERQNNRNGPEKRNMSKKSKKYKKKKSVLKNNNNNNNKKNQKGNSSGGDVILSCVVNE